MTTTKATNLPLAAFGPVLTTRRINKELPAGLVRYLLSQHFANDWGELTEHDQLMNAETCTAGEGRICSSYQRPEANSDIWIHSYVSSDPADQANPDYCNTTVMFSEEY